MKNIIIIFLVVQHSSERTSKSFLSSALFSTLLKVRPCDARSPPPALVNPKVPKVHFAAAFIRRYNRLTLHNKPGWRCFLYRMVQLCVQNYTPLPNTHPPTQPASQSASQYTCKHNDVTHSSGRHTHINKEKNMLPWAGSVWFI